MQKMIVQNRLYHTYFPLLGVPEVNAFVLWTLRDYFQLLWGAKYIIHLPYLKSAYQILNYHFIHHVLTCISEPRDPILVLYVQKAMTQP